MPDCRFCGEPGAFDTGFTVECCNVKCDHYNEEQRIRRADEALKRLELQRTLEEYMKETKTDDDITPVYKWGVRSVHWPDPED